MRQAVMCDTKDNNVHYANCQRRLSGVDNVKNAMTFTIILLFFDWENN